jgi:hypothetical protein
LSSSFLLGVIGSSLSVISATFSTLSITSLGIFLSFSIVSIAVSATNSGDNIC